MRLGTHDGEADPGEGREAESSRAPSLRERENDIKCGSLAGKEKCGERQDLDLKQSEVAEFTTCLETDWTSV